MKWNDFYAHIWLTCFSSLSGDWVAGVYTGRGTMTYADKSFYVGDWLNGKMHGIGELYVNFVLVILRSCWRLVHREHAQHL